MPGATDLREAMERLEQMYHDNVYAFYQRHEHRFDTSFLSAVRAVMSVPASEAGCERLFSIAQRVLTRDRNRLAPARLSHIVCAASTLRRMGVHTASGAAALEALEGVFS